MRGRDDRLAIQVVFNRHPFIIPFAKQKTRRVGVDLPPELDAALSYLDRLSQVLSLVQPQAVSRAIEVILQTCAGGGRVYVMGNGGSAAIASQFVCNLTKTAQAPPRAAIRAFSLTDNAPSLTAWANDVAYDQIFARQIEVLVEPRDLVIAISASGNSPNVVAGLNAAKRVGAHTMGLLGFDGGAALGIVDVAVHVPCADYGLVEDTYMALGHAFTRAIKVALGDFTANATQGEKTRGQT